VGATKSQYLRTILSIYWTNASFFFFYGKLIKLISQINSRGRTYSPSGGLFFPLLNFISSDCSHANPPPRSIRAAITVVHTCSTLFMPRKEVFLVTDVGHLLMGRAVDHFLWRWKDKRSLFAFLQRTSRPLCFKYQTSSQQRLGHPHSLFTAGSIVFLIMVVIYHYAWSFSHTTLLISFNSPQKCPPLTYNHNSFFERIHPHTQTNTPIIINYLRENTHTHTPLIINSINKKNHWSKKKKFHLRAIIPSRGEDMSLIYAIPEYRYTK